MRAREWPFVGRDGLVRALAARLDVRSSPAATVVLTGPAGIGKSRVADEVAARLRAEGVEVMRLYATAALREG